MELLQRILSASSIRELCLRGCLPAPSEVTPNGLTGIDRAWKDITVRLSEQVPCATEASSSISDRPTAGLADERAQA
jgi:hypothetical protein